MIIKFIILLRYINENITLDTDEYIIDYKYQTIVLDCMDSKINFSCVIIVTNYGTFIFKKFTAPNVNIYKGTYKLPDDILFVITECINHITDSTNLSFSNKYDKIVESIRKIKAIITEYTSIPLVDYYFKSKENVKLKDENNKLKYMNE